MIHISTCLPILFPIDEPNSFSSGYGHESWMVGLAWTKIQQNAAKWGFGYLRWVAPSGTKFSDGSGPHSTNDNP